MTTAASIDADDKVSGMPPALRMRLRKMYLREFDDGASLMKFINDKDKNYLRDRAGDLKNYKAEDAVEGDIRHFIRGMNTVLKKKQKK